LQLEGHPIQRSVKLAAKFGELLADVLEFPRLLMD
jgi:hypothetical protein